MTTRSRRTRSGEPKPQTISFTHGGTTYHLPIDGEVGIHTIDDWPTPVPQSGAQNPNDRQLRNKLTIKNIRNAFAGKTGLDWERQGGVINELHDSEAWTHQGPITHARLHQAFQDNVGSYAKVYFMPIHRRSSGGPHMYEVSTSTANPRPCAIYRDGGDNERSLYLGRVTEVATDVLVDYDYDVMKLNVNSLSLTVDHTVLNDYSDGKHGVIDLATHQNALCVLRSWGGSAYFRKLENGTWGSFTNRPLVGANTRFRTFPGARLLSDGETLYFFSVASTNHGVVWGVHSTDDLGATAWTNHITGQGGGRIRDVGFFADQSGLERIVVLTEGQLVWFDPENDTVHVLVTLPFAGRGMARLGDKLLIFMDGMRVWEYSPSGAVRDISPGGMEGMSADKAFGGRC